MNKRLVRAIPLTQESQNLYILHNIKPSFHLFNLGDASKLHPWVHVCHMTLCLKLLSSFFLQ